MIHGANEQQPQAYRIFEGKEVECYVLAKSITWPESD